MSGESRPCLEFGEVYCRLLLPSAGQRADLQARFILFRHETDRQSPPLMLVRVWVKYGWTSKSHFYTYLKVINQARTLLHKKCSSILPFKKKILSCTWESIFKLKFSDSLEVHGDMKTVSLRSRPTLPSPLWHILPGTAPSCLQTSSHVAKLQPHTCK